jgi:hypothetical protein
LDTKIVIPSSARERIRSRLSTIPAGSGVPGQAAGRRIGAIRHASEGTARRPGAALAARMKSGAGFHPLG